MSANPQARLLVPGDLDLRISRSLDGDLPAEEERELRDLLASDPAARARYDAMARLVGRLEELPEPETPFALATRVHSQVEEDTRGLAASLHRFGFYFRPATLGVVGAGIVAVALTYTVVSPRKPDTTIAAAKGAPAAPAAAEDGRVTVFLGDSSKGRKDAPAREAAPAAPAKAPAAANEAKRDSRQEPVLVASAEAPRDKQEQAGFAPERDALAPAPAAAAPEPARRAREEAAESAGGRAALQKSAVSVEAAAAAPGTRTAGSFRGGVVTEIVGKSAGSLRLAAPPRLDGLAGPFEGTYRLELDRSGRVVEVARLFGGSGSEPAALPERLKGLAFEPVEAARAAGSVDVKVRLP